MTGIQTCALPIYHPTDAPFVKTLDKIMEYETKVNEELELLLHLKAEI